MITVVDARKNYGDFAALDNVTLDIPAGSLTALLGPSGSGKSTLLRSIAGLEQLDGGRIVIGGRDVTGVSPQKRGIGFVFQHYAAFKHMTVRDNVAFGLTIRKRPKAEIARKVDDLLEIVGLDGFQHRYPAQLSGGQRQRMALTPRSGPTCGSGCAGCTTRSTSPRSSSPTTRRRRSTSPTGSPCSTRAGSNRWVTP
jgi:sulfate transport system ATP-binding protein